MDKKVKRKKVLVVGEFCDDIRVIGRVERLSPEGPVPIFVPSTKFTVNGMAGNVYNNIKSLNPDLDVYFLHQNRTIIKKTRYVDENSGYILLRVDENDKINKEEELTELKIREFLNNLGLDFEDFSAIVISSYKNYISNNIIHYLSQVCLVHNIPIFVDCKHILGAWSKDVTFVKINRKEYDYNVNYYLKTRGNLENFCHNLIVTLGENGSKHIQSNRVVPTVSCSPVDVCGAGDVYLAAFVVVWLSSQNLEDAMLYANYAANLSVTKRGTVSIDKKELDDFIDNNPVF